MALTLQNWGRVSATANEPITTLQDSSVIGAPRVYSYVTADSQATVAASGYFNAGVANQGVSRDLVSGDLIVVRSTGDATTVWYTVTNTAGVITTAVFSSAAPVGTADITDHAVTYAKIQQASATTLIGNPTGGLANVEEVTLGNSLDFTGTTLEVSPTVATSVRVSMAAADWNGMYAAPFQLVAAPGANKMIVVDSIAFNCVFGSAQFAAGGAVAAQYDSTVHGAGTLATGTIAAATVNGIAASSIFILMPAAVTATADTAVVNKGLFLSNIAGAFTTGDSAFVVDVRYRVVPTV